MPLTGNKYCNLESDDEILDEESESDNNFETLTEYKENNLI